MLWRLSKLKDINIVRLINYLIPSFDKRICSKGREFVKRKELSCLRNISYANGFLFLHIAIQPIVSCIRFAQGMLLFSLIRKPFPFSSHCDSSNCIVQRFCKANKRPNGSNWWWVNCVCENGWELCWCELFVFDGNSKRHYLSQQNDYFDGRQSCSDVHRWGRTVRTKFLLLCDIALDILKHELNIINRRNNTDRKGCLFGRKCSFKIQNFHWIYLIPNNI